MQLCLPAHACACAPCCTRGMGRPSRCACAGSAWRRARLGGQRGRTTSHGAPADVQQSWCSSSSGLSGSIGSGGPRVNQQLQKAAAGRHRASTAHLQIHAQSNTIDAASTAAAPWLRGHRAPAHLVAWRVLRPLRRRTHGRSHPPSLGMAPPVSGRRRPGSGSLRALPCRAVPGTSETGIAAPLPCCAAAAALSRLRTTHLVRVHEPGASVVFLHCPLPRNCAW